MAGDGGRADSGSAVRVAAGILAWVYKAEKWIAATAFGVMAVLVLSDIILRELVGRSFPTGPKLGIFLMIWGGFLGASLTSAKGAHLRAEAALRLWPKWAKPMVETVEQVITALFCGFMAYLAITYVIVSRELAEAETVTGIQLWIIQLVIPYTFLSLTLRHGLYAIVPALRPTVSLEDIK